MKRFSDFANEPLRLEGGKTRIDSILNKDIKITGFNFKKSKYSKNDSGKYLTVQFEGEDGVKKIFFTGSDVLIGQMGKYGK